MCVCVYVCMSYSMYVCMHVCKYASTFVSKHVCMYAPNCADDEAARGQNKIVDRGRRNLNAGKTSEEGGGCMPWGEILRGGRTVESGGKGQNTDRETREGQRQANGTRGDFGLSTRVDGKERAENVGLFHIL